MSNNLAKYVKPSRQDNVIWRQCNIVLKDNNLKTLLLEAINQIYFEILYMDDLNLSAPKTFALDMDEDIDRAEMEAILGLPII